jgi:hypothetical protein
MIRPSQKIEPASRHTHDIFHTTPRPLGHPAPHEPPPPMPTVIRWTIEEVVSCAPLSMTSTTTV